MGLGERQSSPELQRKLTETAARTSSFVSAAKLAQVWCDQKFASRTLARTVEEIGQELVEQRDARVADFTHHRRQAEGPDPQHACVGVFTDGGRAQTREEPCGPGVHGERWQEDKIARLQTFASTTHTVDPCPELPACFRTPILGPSGKGRSSKSPENPSELSSFLDGKPTQDETPRWQPEPLVRTCVGTMESIDGFRWMVQAEAKRRHFYTAKRKAFVADGSNTNWSLHAKHFSDFVPILDFVHAAEYLHAASKAIGSTTQGLAWVEQLWQGASVSVIEQLTAECVSRGIGEEPLADDHEFKSLQEARGYLSNASGKLDYPRYRRLGLPTTSSLVESQIKEFNSRLKGTEKFWYESNAEAMLEIVCWTLREDGETLEDYFADRKTSPLRRGNPKTIAH